MDSSEAIEDDEDANGPSESAFGAWLQEEMEKKKLKIQDLVLRSGISRAGIWNILKGNTISPRQETRERLAKVLDQTIPPDVESKIENEATPIPGLTWEGFTPQDLQTVPEKAGVYVFYDTTDRPVYVGKSNSSVRSRVKDHQTRFWFKEPLVTRGAFLAVPEKEFCDKIEQILITFLGRHALLNKKGATKDLSD